MEHFNLFFENSFFYKFNNSFKCFVIFIMISTIVKSFLISTLLLPFNFLANFFVVYVNFTLVHRSCYTSHVKSSLLVLFTMPFGYFLWIGLIGITGSGVFGNKVSLANTGQLPVIWEKSSVTTQSLLSPPLSIAATVIFQYCTASFSCLSCNHI